MVNNNYQNLAKSLNFENQLISKNYTSAGAYLEALFLTNLNQPPLSREVDEIVNKGKSIFMKDPYRMKKGDIKEIFFSQGHSIQEATDFNYEFDTLLSVGFDTKIEFPCYMVVSREKKKEQEKELFELLWVFAPRDVTI